MMHCVLQFGKFFFIFFFQVCVLGLDGDGLFAYNVKESFVRPTGAFHHHIFSYLLFPFLIDSHLYISNSS